PHTPAQPITLISRRVDRAAICGSGHTAVAVKACVIDVEAVAILHRAERRAHELVAGATRDRTQKTEPSCCTTAARTRRDTSGVIARRESRTNSEPTGRLELPTGGLRMRSNRA